MKRIVSIVCLLLLAFSTGAFAQGTTASIGSVTAQVGQSVNVPINVTNFTNIGAISLTIAYNPAALTFTGVANAPSGVNIIAGASGGVISLGWFDATTTSPLNITSGKLVDMVFTYNGGSSQLVFNAGNCEVTTDAVPSTTVQVTYSNGVVGAVGVKLTLGTLNAAKGSAINVPINVENFNKIGSVSLKIGYNPAVLSFTGTANAAGGINFTAGASSGVLSLGWFDPTGKGVSIGNVKLVDLQFNYVSGTSPLTFQTSQCEIADSSAAVLAAAFVDGLVSPLASEAVTLSLDSTAYAAGATFLMPLKVRNFAGVGAISLKIKYNPAVLTFNGLANTVRPVGTFTTSTVAGVLTIGWYSPGSVVPPITLTGKLLDINFTYNGGTTALEFQPALSEISDSVGTPQGALYTNGNVVLFTPRAGWNAQTSGVTANLWAVKTVSASVGWAVGDGGVVLRTINGGYSWVSVGGGAAWAGDVNAVCATSQDTASVGVNTATGGFIYSTTNGGSSWTQSFAQPGGFIDGLSMTSSTTGVGVGDPVGGKWTVVKTSDAGVTWSRIATEPAQVSTEYGAVNGLMTIGTSYIWFTPGNPAGGKRVYRSTDGGATWASSDLPFAAFTPAIWFVDTKIGIVGGTGTAGGLVRTVDGGATWSTIAFSGGTGSFYAASGAGVDVWLSRGVSIFRSVNRGATWGLTPEFTFGNTIYGMNVGRFGSSIFGWATTAGGSIAAAALIPPTGVGPTPGGTLPEAFDLLQNYPNPFNPSTTIEYALPQRSNVTLRIYDMLGQEVRTLATGVQEAGTFRAVWDGRNNVGSTVSTGLYLYRIEASPVDGGNVFASFKKMLLLK